MGICASNTERIYTYSSEALRRPWYVLLRELKLPLVYGYLRINLLKVAVGRYYPIFKYQGSFYNPMD